MNKVSKSKSFYYSILALITVCALVNIIYTFTHTKFNYMTDEAWSYGLSNSYYDPFIFSSATMKYSRMPENYQNFNTWITSDVFWDYIVVNEGEEFTYDSVWYNQVNDIHPPVYYLILHTISSFFPETFSLWYAFSINIVSFIIVVFLLYKCAVTLTKSQMFSVMLVAFYAFNCAAVDTFIFLRMYALNTIFYLGLFYCVQKMLLKERWNVRNLLALFLLTLTGSLIHYHFIIYAFFLTVATCTYYLFGKKIKKMFGFGFTMLFSVLCSLLIFPAMLEHTAINFGQTIVNVYRFSLRYIASLLCGYLMGYTFTPYETMTDTYIFLGIIIFVFFAVPFWFVFRNETWMKNLLFKIRIGIVAFCKRVKKCVLSIEPIYYIALFTVVGVFLFFVFTLPILALYRVACRYLFTIIPLFYFVLFVGLYYIAKAFSLPMKQLKYGFVVITVICSITSNVFFQPTFAYGYYTRSGKTLDKLEENSTVIIATKKGWLLTAYPFRLLQSGNICVVDLEHLYDLENELDTLPASSEGTPVYLVYEGNESEKETEKEDDASSENRLIIKVEGEEDSQDHLEYFKSLPYVDKCELVGKDWVYDNEVKIYQLR